MRELPSQFERARELAKLRSADHADARRIDAFRRALAEVYGEQVPLLTKIIADGRADKDERDAIEGANSLLARYYGLALSLAQDEELGRSIEALRSSIEQQAHALGLALDKDQSEAMAARHHALALLNTIPPASEPGDPRLIHGEAEIVYDRATGRSKYDADSDGWLSFGLRCPNEGCKQLRPYRLLPRHPTHKFVCSACGVPFLLFVATVVSAERSHRHSSATHNILALGADGATHQVVFDHSRDEGDVEMNPEDLVLFTYEVGGRLKLVRNYSRGKELTVTTNGRCFVATAALGPWAPEVLTLRRYRDEVLLERRSGRAFVAFYELIGPPLAAVIERSDPLRRAARGMVRLAARLVPRL